MRKLSLILLIFFILSLSACSNQSAELASLKAENEKLRSELVSKNANIDEALKKEQAAKELAEKQEYIKQSEAYRPKIQETYDIISKHYSDLVAEYDKQKASYNETEWGIFLRNWNIQLKNYRADLDTYKANGHTPNLFYAERNIIGASTSMSAVWLYYSGLLKNKNDIDAKDNLEYYDNDIVLFMGDAKKYLELGN